MSNLAEKLRVAGRRSLVALARRSLGVGVAAWAWLRAVSGDDAYERYLAHHQEKHAGQGPPLSRKDFYRQRLEHQYDPANPSRCC
ncbi:MAG: YbdD/YjiX family protein [Candidatus Acidoferrales bacterium]